jgi:hypothetical protein
VAKVFYANLNVRELNFAHKAKYKADALRIFQHLARDFRCSNAAGQPLTIEVWLDDINQDRPSFVEALARIVAPRSYRIEIGVGLVAQLSTVAEAIAADTSILRGRRRSRILLNEVRADGRAKALGDFVFTFMLAFVFWHEVAHIALGHLDWLVKDRGRAALGEFAMKETTATQAAARRALEADADQMAAQWTAIRIDDALQNNPYLRYTSVSDAMYDIGFVYGALFQFLAAAEGDCHPTLRTHPDSHVRMGVAWSFVQRYLDLVHRDASAVLQREVYAGGIRALQKIVHESVRPFDLLRVAEFIYRNGETIKALNVRQLQHTVSVGPSSFKILD